MQVKNIALVLALSSVFAGSAMAQDVRDGSFVTADGFTLSAPAYTPSTANRADVRAQAVEAARAAIANPQVAEGLGDTTQTVVTGTRSRDAVRAEAIQAARDAYASSAQANEGLAG